MKCKKSKIHQKSKISECAQKSKAFLTFEHVRKNQRFFQTKGQINALGIFLLSMAIFFVLLGLFIYLAAKYDFNWLEGFLPRKYQPELVTKEKIAIIDAYNDLYKIFSENKGGGGNCIINFNLPDLKKYKIEFSEEGDTLYIKLENEQSDMRTIEGLKPCVVAGITDGEMIAINFYDNWLDDLKCNPNYKVEGLSEEEKTNILSRFPEKQRVCLERNENLEGGEGLSIPLFIRHPFGWWNVRCGKCGVRGCSKYINEDYCKLDPCRIGCISENGKCVDSKECKKKDYSEVGEIIIENKKITFDGQTAEFENEKGEMSDVLYKADGEHICFIPTKSWVGSNPYKCDYSEDRLDNHCIDKIKEIRECGEVEADKKCENLEEDACIANNKCTWLPNSRKCVESEEVEFELLKDKVIAIDPGCEGDKELNFEIGEELLNLIKPHSDKAFLTREEDCEKKESKKEERCKYANDKNAEIFVSVQSTDYYYKEKVYYFMYEENGKPSKYGEKLAWFIGNELGFGIEGSSEMTLLKKTRMPAVVIYFLKGNVNKEERAKQVLKGIVNYFEFKEEEDNEIIPEEAEIVNKKIKKYEDVIEEASTDFVSVPLIKGVIAIESDGKADAKSSADAYGLMQMTEIAVADLNEKTDEEWDWSEIKDPDKGEINIKAGTAYLTLVNEHYVRKYLELEDETESSLAIYNAGVGTVGKARDKCLEKTTLCYTFDAYKEYLPKDETRDYVPKVLAYKVVFEKIG